MKLLYILCIVLVICWFVAYKQAGLFDNLNLEIVKLHQKARKLSLEKNRNIDNLKTELELCRIQGIIVDLAPMLPKRSEERRVGKECRSRWSPYH